MEVENVVRRSIVVLQVVGLRMLLISANTFDSGLEFLSPPGVAGCFLACGWCFLLGTPPMSRDGQGREKETGETTGTDEQTNT